jgi:hypothetical protein
MFHKELEVFSMKLPIKKLGIFLILQVVIFVTSLLYNNKVSLRNYIDISFYYSSAFLLTGLLIYIMRTGFFDLVYKGFAKTFARKSEEINSADIPPLSKLVAINQQPLLFYGFLLCLCMLIALIAYYV